jgi:hypothetical protein
MWLSLWKIVRSSVILLLPLLSTLSKDDLVQVCKNTDFKIDDVLVLRDIDDTRENLCKLVSFALEQKRQEWYRSAVGGNTGPT